MLLNLNLNLNLNPDTGKAVSLYQKYPWNSYYVCIMWGRTGGSGPPTPGVQPLPPPIFPLPTPAHFFHYFFFRVPPPKIQIFLPPTPAHLRPPPPPPPPRPRPVLVKSPPTPAPLTPGPPPPLSSPTIMHGGHQLQTRPVLIRSIPICKKFSQESHHRFSVRANYVVSFVSS